MPYFSPYLKILFFYLLATSFIVTVSNGSLDVAIIHAFIHFPELTPDSSTMQHSET